MAGTCRLELAQQLKADHWPQGRWNGDGSCQRACWAHTGGLATCPPLPLDHYQQPGQEEGLSRSPVAAQLSLGILTGPEEETCLSTAPTRGNTGGIMSRLGFYPMLPSGCLLCNWAVAWGFPVLPGCASGVLPHRLPSESISPGWPRVGLRLALLPCHEWALGSFMTLSTASLGTSYFEPPIMPKSAQDV